MNDLLTQEQRTYTDVWAIDAYANTSPGEQLVPVFQEMSGAKYGQSVLDAGCGTGRGGVALKKAGFDVDLCDLTDAGLCDEARSFRFSKACLWQPLRQQLPFVRWQTHDWVYCCDVLEHIPPTFTMLVVSRLLEHARHGVFLSISLTNDIFGAWVGKQLHQSVQSFPEWSKQLAALGAVKEARDFLHAGIFLVTKPC